MTDNPWGRYRSTQQFLAELDDEDRGPIADDDGLGAVDLDDEPIAGDLGYDEPIAGDLGYGEAGYDEPEHPTTRIEPDYRDTDGGDIDERGGAATPAFPAPALEDLHPDAITFGGADPDGEALTAPDFYDPATLPADTDDADETEDFGEIGSAGTEPRFSKPVVIGFVAVVAVVTLGLAAAMVGMQSSPTAAPPEAGSATHAPVVPPPPPAPAAPVADPAEDVPIPFQASSPCPQAGAGAAQNVASDDPARAWVCMRDSDGQILTLDMGKPMKVTAISLTPGWVGTDASGADQWMRHRVVTRVQWILINGADRTVVTQDTNNAHGPVVQPMPSNGPDQGVLASKIQMIILQTSRPPADTPATPGPGADPSTGGGFLDSVLGAPLSGAPAAPASEDPNFGGTEGNSDPVDNTVAISSIQVIGHPPL